MFPAEQSVNKGILKSRDKIYLEYAEKGSGKIKKEDIFLKKESPFVPCDDSSSSAGKDGKIQYCSIAEDDYKKGYIWFAAEQPPVGMIDTPNESPLCYRFPAVSLDWQLQRLKEKYGIALYDEKIIKESDGSSSLAVKRKDESGKEIVYFYFDNPELCAEYQTKRLGEMPPIPYYDYSGCIGECCQYAAWTAKEKVILRKDHSDLSPTVATIEADEKVDAFTGVVLTKQIGKIKVLSDTVLDCDATFDDEEINTGIKLPFKSGGYIYLIHYVGESRYLLWKTGQIHECDIPFEEKYFQEINEDQSEWWAKISTKDGKTGWTREIEKFINVYSNE